MLFLEKTKEFIISFVMLSIFVGFGLWYFLTIETNNTPFLVLIAPVFSFIWVFIMAFFYRGIIDSHKMNISKFHDATNHASKSGSQASMLLMIVVLIIGLNQNVLKLSNAVLFGLLILPPAMSSFSYSIAAFTMYFGISRKNNEMNKYALSFYELGNFLSLASMVSVTLLFVLVLLSVGKA